VKAIYGAISDTYKKSTELDYAIDDGGFKVIQASRRAVEAYFDKGGVAPTLLMDLLTLTPTLTLTLKVVWLLRC